MSNDLSAAPVNSEKLQELRELFGDDREVVSLYRDFFHEVPAHLDTLSQAIRQGCADSIHRAAHTLKGSSGGLGANGVQDAAFELEKCSRAETLDGADLQLQKLEEELERLRGWLSQNQLL